MHKRVLSILLALLCMPSFASVDRGRSPQLPPMDGVRHGVTIEVFERFIHELSLHEYEVSRSGDGAAQDFMGGQCAGLLSEVRAGKAVYLAPKFATDDYADPRFDIYKNAYRRALGNKNSRVPGASWFGGGIESRSEALHRPTRNFAVYELDLDSDNSSEIIFYGEFIVRDRWGSPGDNDTALVEGGGVFWIYKYKNQDLISEGGIFSPNEYDYKELKHTENSSAVFFYQHIPYIALFTVRGDDRMIELFRLGLTGSPKTDNRFYYQNVCSFIKK